MFFFSYVSWFFDSFRPNETWAERNHLITHNSQLNVWMKITPDSIHSKELLCAVMYVWDRFSIILLFNGLHIKILPSGYWLPRIRMNRDNNKENVFKISWQIQWYYIDRIISREKKTKTTNCYNCRSELWSLLYWATHFPNTMNYLFENN